MDAVLEASARGEGKVQTLGPLIHNPQALSLIERRGVGVVSSLEDVQDGTVVIRAHGIPIQDLRTLKARQDKGGLKIINATCPEVAKVHSRIKKFSPKGYFTVILGIRGHAESTAHQSFAEHGSIIISTMEEARALTEEQLKRVLVVAQTTFTLKDFHEISNYLREHSGDIIVENTICEDTWTRQEEARELAKSVDAVVVVGGKNSSNTKHLAELAHHYGKPVQFVETAEELDLTTLAGNGTVGILAGASTPTWLVEDVVAVIEQAGKGPGRFARLMRAAFSTPIVLALGAAFMTAGIHHLLGLPEDPRYSILVGAYVMAMYMLNQFLDPMGLGNRGPVRKAFLERHRTALVSVGVLSSVTSLVVAGSLGLGSLLMVLAASVAGLTYKRGFRLGNHQLSLKMIPASKDILVAVALALLSVAVPLWHYDWVWDPRAWSGVLLVATLAFARTTIHDLREMQNDQILGRETLPILIGRNPTKMVLVSLLALALVAVLALTPFGRFHHPLLAVALLVAAAAYPVAHLWLYHDRFTVGRSRSRMGVEISFYLLGLLLLV